MQNIISITAMASLEKKWGHANTLVKAALAWQAGANFQPDADLWMVKDSATSAFNTHISSKCIPFNIGIG
jgi:hypothetical protein